MTSLLPAPDETRDGPLEIIRFCALRPGPRLLVLGAVHGNETCGPNAIARAIDDIRAGRVMIERGEVTFVPIVNQKAWRLRNREGDRNLNRDLRDKPVPLDNEDRVGNRVCALLREHDVLLDLHSFRGEGVPFVFCGPPDNAGDLEPFAHARAEMAFARCLGVGVVMYGWLEAYRGVIEARARLGLPPLLPTEGHGTTEYMRFAGGYGVTLECGSHDDPASAQVGWRAIVNALAHLGLSSDAAPEPAAATIIHVREMVLCEHDGDRPAQSWRTADPVRRGEPLVLRSDGAILAAAEDGHVVFPNRSARRGESVLYFGVPGARR